MVRDCPAPIGGLNGEPARLQDRGSGDVPPVGCVADAWLLDRLSYRMETAPPLWDINVGHNAREPSAGLLADSGLSWRILIASMYQCVSLAPPSY
jgi:hypothetical protein